MKNKKYDNGSTIKFLGTDLKTFSPEFEKIAENFSKASEKFSSHLIENGKHFSIKGKIKNGNIFIEEENIEDTDAADNEYILYSPFGG